MEAINGIELSDCVISRRLAFFSIAALSACVPVLAHAQGKKFSLDGSVFDRASKAIEVDSYLLYAVALAESALYRGQGTVGPWPWALRTTKPYYPKSLSEAIPLLRSLRGSHGNAIDIGMMQINLRWNGHRVSDVESLFDPLININVAGLILKEAIASSPNDLALGIGRYHHWNDQDISRNYGSRVIAIYRNLRNLRVP